MGKLTNILAGFAGATLLNLLHESLKHQAEDMPRIDLLGEEALDKTLRHFDAEINDDKRLYQATLAGDILSNTIYYSLIGAGSRKYLWPRAILSGISAGVGAVKLAKPLGLNPEPVSKTQKTKALTVVYYLSGALFTACVIDLITKGKPVL